MGLNLTSLNAQRLRDPGFARRVLVNLKTAVQMLPRCRRPISF